MVVQAIADVTPLPDNHNADVINANLGKTLVCYLTLGTDAVNHSCTVTVVSLNQ